MFYKKCLIDEVGAEAEYNQHVINEVLSRFPDCIYYVAEVINYPNLSKRDHYRYLMYSIPKGKRFVELEKAKKDYRFNAIREYYNYSYSKTEEVMRVLTEEQKNAIVTKMINGGYVEDK